MGIVYSLHPIQKSMYITARKLTGKKARFMDLTEEIKSLVPTTPEKRENGATLPARV